MASAGRAGGVWLVAASRKMQNPLGSVRLDEEEEPPTSFGRRARTFIFGEQAEHERFGIFDPFMRWTYVVGAFIAVVLVGGSILELLGAQPTGISAAALAAGALLFGALRMHGRIWRKPSEREILLQLAREDDEARALRERLELEDIEARKRA